MIEVTVKTCTECGVQKELSEFYFDKHISKLGRHRSRCRACHTARSRRWNIEHPDRHQINLRNNRVRKYGITHDQYEAMFKEQEGACAICRQPETLRYRKSVRMLSVDHCHKTGRVRGLLCFHCNSAIGKLKEDPALFLAAMEYLKRST